jgi:Concanavalin A-like lectin/glucanases superfamily
MVVALAAVPGFFPANAAAQSAPYAGAVLASPALEAYWRLGDSSGTVAHDTTGHAPGSYTGAPGLGARGALRADADTATRFDGVDDEMQAGGASVASAATLEGWFFWEAGVALMRDSTGSAGWILAYDGGGRVAYRAGGTTFTTSVATASLRDGWHHVALTVAGGATRFYIDGDLVHSGAEAGAAAAAMPWHVMRNGTTGQYTRGRADEVAVYDAALDASVIGSHFEAGRDTNDTTAPSAPSGVSATARLGRVELVWSDAPEADLDGYDVFRATSPEGPFTRVNAERLRTPAYTDTSVTGGTAYVYAITASDIANNRSPRSGLASATPPSTEELLRRYSPDLRYESQETYFADSAAEMTDNFVAGKRQNYLVASGGTRLAAANPADPLANLSLDYLGDPVYADGRAAATSDYLDAANSYYQQDAQRMRAAGYGDRIYGRVATVGGKTWLQYWFFSYYNPQNVLGFGVHEGDWEFAQVGLDSDGAPDVATYAQHGGGERCSWSQVQKTSAGAPIVYVALASHASYFSSGVNPRGIYPDDYHRGGGYRVRPALDVVTGSTPFIAWRGRWGASSSSPVAPRQQGKWGAPNNFNAEAAACTVGATQARASASARLMRSDVPAPRMAVSRSGARVSARYRFPRLGRGRATRPVTLLVSVARADAPDVAAARRVPVRRRAGTASVRLPPGAGGRYVVRASAFSAHGARSRLVSALLR